MSLKATLTSLRAIVSTQVGQFLLVRRLLDAPLLTDAEFRAFFKVLNDGAGVAEVASLQSGKVEGDSVSANTDAMVLSFAKSITESPSAADAGSARGQGYSDFDYFAEDYVGYSWTF